MQNRYLSLVTAIAASTMLACGDAAVDEVTAPPLAATPAPPVADNWPTITELQASGWQPSTAVLGIQVYVSPQFEEDYAWFVVDARVQFQWANEVSANLTASLLNRAGQTVNQGSAGMSYRRLALPVASGDTTFTVKISTNGQKCGLIGKSTYSGAARLNALNFQLVQMVLFEQLIPSTNGPDAMQPICPPPPPPAPTCDEPVYRIIVPTGAIPPDDGGDCEDAPAPTGGGGTQVEVCYTVWREYWVYDWMTGRYTLVLTVALGSWCETVAM